MTRFAVYDADSRLVVEVSDTTVRIRGDVQLHTHVNFIPVKIYTAAGRLCAEDDGTGTKIYPGEGLEVLD